MKRRTITKIDFDADSHGVSIPGQDQSVDIRFVSDGKRHQALVFVYTSSIKFHCDDKATELIHQALSKLAQKNKLSLERCHTHFALDFKLNGQSFCERSIEVGDNVLEALEITYYNRQVYLRCLNIYQTTQVRYLCIWMSYSEYLCFTNPILNARL